MSFKSKKPLYQPGEMMYHNGKPIGVYQPEQTTEPVKPAAKPKQKKKKELPTGDIVPMSQQMAYQQPTDTKKKPVVVDLFGDKVESDVLLRDKFIEPPFSVLDTKGGNWRQRTRLWKGKGIKSEVGRDATTFNMSEWLKDKPKDGPQHMSDTSIFDPTLCELMYHWFCPVGGTILDSFAGGSVRGIVANYLGYRYTGVELRPEQVMSNEQQAKEIFTKKNQRPEWITGDSNVELDNIRNSGRAFDFLFSCPPYADLEVYSDLPADLSNKPYVEFITLYRSIIRKSVELLKHGSYAAWVVGEVRNKKGNYIGFVPDTIRAFIDAGMSYYNEAILLNSIASASMRADGNMKYQKLVKCHQNVLIFRK